MIQSIPYDEVEMGHGHPDLSMNEIKENLNTPDGIDIGYFVEVDLRYPNNIKEKTQSFPFCYEYKGIPYEKYNEYMKKVKPKKKLNGLIKRNIQFILEC